MKTITISLDKKFRLPRKHKKAFAKMYYMPDLLYIGKRRQDELIYSAYKEIFE